MKYLRRLSGLAVSLLLQFVMVLALSVGAEGTEKQATILFTLTCILISSRSGQRMEESPEAMPG